MTALTGVLVSTHFADDAVGVISGNLIAADSGVILEAWEGAHIEASGATAGGPVSVISSAKTGHKLRSSSGLDTFYYRIVIEPARMDLGNLVNAQVRSVIVWNGFFIDKTMDATSGVGMEGIDVTAPGIPPFTVPPLEELTYEFNVSLAGPPTVDALYTWTIDGVDYNLPVTGTRVVLWPFAPNWSQPVVESLEWLTRVGRAYDGTEQRASLRYEARRRLSYNFNVLRDETQRFDNITWGWQNRPFAVPIWQYKKTTTGAITSGDPSVPVQTANTGFAAGNLAVIIESADIYEVVEIQTVNASSLTLARPAQYSWPAGTRVYPVAVCNVEGNIPVARLTDSVLTGAVRFIAHPVDVSPYTPDAAAPTSYNGYESLLVQPDWSGGLSADRDFPTLVGDSGVGRMTWTVTTSAPIWLRQYKWTFKSRAAAEDFREFLQRRKGQFTAVYIPTWNDDFTLMQGIGASDTTIVVRDYQYAQMVGLNDYKAHLYIRTTSGVNYTRPIAGVAQGAGSVSLGITTALGVPYTVDQVKAIHLMMLWRLASDEVQLNWLTDEVVTVTATFQAVKA